MRVAVVCVLGVLGSAAAFGASPAPVFTKDVLPILQSKCQGCHRPREIAPMSFLTYKDVRPRAKAIREAVLVKKMPPWFADRHYGKFRNDQSLNQTQIDTVAAWVDAGAPEGEAKDAPPPVEFVEGWGMGQPDLVLEMPQEFQVPASGTIPYQHFVIPTGFKEDKWVSIAELRPGNRKLVHHALIFVRPPGSKYFADAKPVEAFVPKEDWRFGRTPYDEFLDFYVPGVGPQILAQGEAKLIKAGSDLIFQVHYTTNGKAGADRSKIGLTFSKGPPAKRVYTLAVATDKFVIPPGAPDTEVQSKFTLQHDVSVVSMNPHMHLRGKSFDYRMIFPDGRDETLLRVANYIFFWQMPYILTDPLTLPRGTRIECTAHFDNSPNNPRNPDPKAEVRWGDQSWDEMMVGFIDVAFDAKIDVMDLFRPRKQASGGE